MDALLHHLALGFGAALTLQDLLFALGGCLLGMLAGVLPGLGGLATLAMLLPLVYVLNAMPALIMLAGVYCGAQYGAATRALLIPASGAPGAPPEGDRTALKRRAGAVFVVAVLGVFFAASVSVALFAGLAGPLGELASRLEPAECFSLMVLVLVGAVALSSGSLLKPIAMSVLGLLLGQIRIDVSASGVLRVSLDSTQQAHGLVFVLIAVGLLGFGQIIARLGHPAAHRELITADLTSARLTREDIQRSWPSLLRGTALGNLLGLLPGGSALLASFVAQALEGRLDRDPRARHGSEAVERAAASRSARHAGALTNFLPAWVLGIPVNADMALILGVLIIKGIRPGPQVMNSALGLFWGLVAALWIVNLMLVLLNLPLVGLWARLSKAPYRLLFPALVVLGCMGIYAMNRDPLGVHTAALFALIGYLLHKLSCEPTHLLLGFVLSPMMEENLHRTLSQSRGDWSILLSRPVSAGLLVVAALLIIAAVLPSIRSMRARAFREDD